MISEAAFQFGIRFTDKSLSDLFDLIFLINGKVISLHKVIKYVNRDKVFSTISAQNIRLVNLKPSCICTMSLISPWKGTWPFLWTNLNPPYPRMYLCKLGWNWCRCSGEEHMMTKTTTTTDNGQISTIGSTELPAQKKIAKNINIKEFPNPQFVEWYFTWKLTWRQRVLRHSSEIGRQHLALQKQKHTSLPLVYQLWSIRAYSFILANNK